IVEIGLLSQVVVMVTGGFTGAVFAAQTYFQFNKLGMGSATGAVVAVAICRELAPVLSALMVSGRVGAAMSAEIGTMKGTGEIESVRFRDPDRFYFLSQRIDHTGGRGGSGASDDRSGGDLFAGGSDFEFLPDDGAEYCLSGGISVKRCCSCRRHWRQTSTGF